MQNHNPERRKTMPHVDPDQQQEIVQEAIEKWMDKKFAAFGKWTLGSVAAAAFGWLCIFLY